MTPGTDNKASLSRDDVMDGLREAVAEHFAALRVLADPACRICHGQGVTRGYISPGKYASDACPCTSRTTT